MYHDKWEKVVTDIAAGMGYEVVDLDFCQSGLVRIFIDVLGFEREINVGDCEQLTKQLLYQLPVEGLSFDRLEVSSPGVDRKLTKINHFEKFLGCKVKVCLKEPLKGQRNFEGVLGRDGLDKDIINCESSSGNSFSIRVERSDLDMTLSFCVEDLSSARLVGETSVKRRKYE